jgi:hypothetical protein
MLRQPGLARLRQVAAGVLAGSLTLVALVSGASPTQATTTGGPLVLMGIDAEDGGVNGHGPIANYIQITDSVLNSTSNGGNGILVMGANNSTVRSFWNAIGTGTGETVTFVNGSDIGSHGFAGYQMLAVVSDWFNTFGGMTDFENQQIATRRADVATFINGGGGLLGFMSQFSSASGGPYPYLADVGSFSFNFPAQFFDITPTPAGTAIGVTDAFDICCWHQEYSSFPPFLQVLATNPSTGRAVAVGGVDVVISDIQLSPLSQTRAIGDSASVTATVLENGSPVAGTTVTFVVTAGPNSGTTGTATTDASGQATFGFTGTSAGSDSVQASFVDSSGAEQDSNIATVTWESSNQPPQVSAGGPYTGFEGTPLTLDGDATDPDGDPLTLEWSYVAGAGAQPGATCTFGTPNAADTTFTCTDDGQYHVKLTANDGKGGVTDSVMASMLENVAPVMPSLSASTSAPIAVNTSISVNGAFSDAGANDTHTCSIAWGDGSSSAGAVAAKECSGTHSYGAAGIYTVEATVTDDDGGSDTARYEYVVVYDPNAGFVTGGGTMHSPAGAYVADPALSGKATFGFVSKYKKGVATPDGQTQFQFHAAGLNFHSTSYDWLVVSGPKAQYKGRGTINGTGEFGFILTANDGQVSGGGGEDRLRFKVWDTTTGDLVYDSQRGDGDDAAASTSLTGGSIVIHTKK